MIYHYCTVRVVGVRRPYAYLTGDLPLQVGDWVEVPFGKDDLPRRGQVNSLTDCTRATAPWPPEQTKTVLRVVDAPTEPEKTPEEVTRPEPMQTPKTPPVPNEDARSAQSAEEIEAEQAVSEKPDPISVPVPKRRFPWKLVCGGLAISVCLIGGAVYFRTAVTHYQQAEQYLAEHDFQRAVVELSRVPAFYREQEALARYAELCLLAESGTEAASKTALDGLEALLSNSDEALRAQIQPQYERIRKQYTDLLYDTALDCLRNARFKQALDYLRQVPAEYPDTAALLRYAQAGADAKSSDSSYHLQTVLAAMEKLPADYSGAFAAEMAAFKVQLSDMIAAAEANEEARRAEWEAAQAAAQKAEEERLAALAAIGLPYIGMAERDVNATRQLGKAYRSDTEQGRQVYSWYSKANGDLVFQAKCSGGQVVSTVKYGGDAYWNGDTLLVTLGPQIIRRFNSGGDSHDYSVRDDYDNPEDFYEDNRDWFDDEDEAWDYWYED